MSRSLRTPESCERCGADLGRVASTMSRFNTQTICLPCSEDEREAPGYIAAATAETTAVQQGDMNFPGVGLSPADSAFLAERRKARAS